MLRGRWWIVVVGFAACSSQGLVAQAQSPYGRIGGGPVAPSFGATQAAAPANRFPLALPPASGSASPGMASPGSMSPGNLPVLPRCVVKIIDEVNVSVQEPGLVVALEVREGMTVAIDTIVGRVNDGQARMNKLIAEAAYAAAARKAQNDVEILHAEDAAKVAEYAYSAAALANNRSPNAVSQIQLNELALTHQKAMRQIELAKHNTEIYKLEAEAKRVEVEAADDEVRRRQIVAPMAGEVTEVPVHVGQWVQPGDTIFRLVRLDRLSVDGLLNAADYAPNEIVNRPVTIEAELSHGRRQQFSGKVTFVHPEIDNRGKFRIKAEITNIAEEGQFLLFPGKEVDMTIRLDQAPAEAAAPVEYGRDPRAPLSR